jgi:hypothetical protein
MRSASYVLKELVIYTKHLKIKRSICFSHEVKHNLKNKNDDLTTFIIEAQNHFG